MNYEWDENKNAANILKHGADFAWMEVFDWDAALIVRDDRKDYGEPRFVALGFIGDRLYSCIYTRREDARRIISLRKANDRERRVYNEKD